MLDVNSFVVFATPDTPSLRNFHASCDWSRRSAGGASRAPVGSS